MCVCIYILKYRYHKDSHGRMSWSPVARSARSEPSLPRAPRTRHIQLERMAPEQPVAWCKDIMSFPEERPKAGARGAWVEDVWKTGWSGLWVEGPWRDSETHRRDYKTYWAGHFQSLDSSFPVAENHPSCMRKAHLEWLNHEINTTSARSLWTRTVFWWHWT